MSLTVTLVTLVYLCTLCPLSHTTSIAFLPPDNQQHLTLLNHISANSNKQGQIFFQRPSMARLAALQPPSPPGCSYQGAKYSHGDLVVTSEPCLNCTCKKGVLLCFLKVCPTLMHSLSNPRYRSTHDCQVIREPGQCCPIMKCETTSTTVVTGEITTTSDTFDTNAPITITPTAPTSTLKTTTTTSTSTTVTSTHDTSFQPSEGKSDDDDSDSHLYYHSNHKEPSHYSSINFYSRGSPLGEATSTASTPADLATKATALLHVSSASLPAAASSAEEANESTETPVSLAMNVDLPRITVTSKKQGTVILHTSPSASVQDSPKVVTSSPAMLSSTQLYEDQARDLLDPDSSTDGCQLNGTVYAEGSAVMSSSFCEYCYCIRGKKMCIRPRCHLSILGCLPRYSSEWACCPTSYACGSAALYTTPSWTSSGSTSPASTSPASTWYSTILGSTSTAPTSSASVTESPPPSTVSSFESAYKSCREGLTIYRLGEQMPSNETCHNCYCSYGGAKKCKRIHCSPVVAGCTPITPEGHCCPVEYKCNDNNIGKDNKLPASKGNGNRLRSDDSYMDQVDLMATTTQLYPVKENEKEAKDAFYFPSSETTTETTASGENGRLSLHEKAPFLVNSIPVTSVSSEISSIDVDNEAVGKVRDAPTVEAVPTTINSLSVEGRNSADDITLDDLFKSPSAIETTTTVTVMSSPVTSVSLASDPSTSSSSPRVSEFSAKSSIHTANLTSDPAAVTQVTGHSVSHGMDVTSVPIEEKAALHTIDTQSTGPNASASASSVNVSSPIDDVEDVKIQPNQLYASWRLKLPSTSSSSGSSKQNLDDSESPASPSSSSGDSYSNRDRVESILDGIISVLDKRVNLQLPSEPRKQSIELFSSGLFSKSPSNDHHSSEQNSQERKASPIVSSSGKSSRSDDSHPRASFNHHQNDRDTLVNVSLSAPPAQSVNNSTTAPLISEKASRKDDSLYATYNKNPSGESDDEGEEFILPPIATGYISNLEGDANYQRHQGSSMNTDSQRNSQHSPANNEKGGHSFYMSRDKFNGPKINRANHSDSNLNIHSNGPSKKPLDDGNSDVRITHLPKPLDTRSNISSLVASLASSASSSSSPTALFMVESDSDSPSPVGDIITGRVDNSPIHDKIKGTSASSSVDVEIITAKTPFLESNFTNSDSFLINLAPSTLKFGSVESPANVGHKPNGERLPHYSLSPVQHDASRGQPSAVAPSNGRISPLNKPAPSFPSYYGAHGQWRIVTANNRGHMAPPASVHVPTAKSRATNGLVDTLSKRTGHHYTSEASDEKGVSASTASSTSSPKVIAFVSNGGIAPSASFMRRKGTSILSIQPISSSSSSASPSEQAVTADQTELLAAALPLISHDASDPSVKSSGETADPIDKRMDPPSVSSADDSTASSNYSPSVNIDDSSRITELKAQGKLVDDTFMSGHLSPVIASDAQVAYVRNRFAGFPNVPPSVHSFNANRPPLMLDPTSTTLNQNPFPLPGQSPIANSPSHTRVRYNPNQAFSPALVNSMMASGESIDRKDSPVSQGNMLQMAPIGNTNRIKDFAITPSIPPKPGTLGGPGFFAPSSRPVAHSQPPSPQPNYNRIPINQLGAIWQNRPPVQQPSVQEAQRPFSPHQIPASGSNAPQGHPARGPQGSIGSIHHTSKIYSSASASMPSHVDPPPVHRVIQQQAPPQQQQLSPASSLNVFPKPVRASPPATPAQPAIAPQANLPPKMYATANELTTKAPIVIASTTVLPISVQSPVTERFDSSNNKSVFNMVMNAATAWDSFVNEVTSSVSTSTVAPTAGESESESKVTGASDATGPEGTTSSQSVKTTATVQTSSFADHSTVASLLPSSSSSSPSPSPVASTSSSDESPTAAKSPQLSSQQRAEPPAITLTTVAPVIASGYPYSPSSMTTQVPMTSTPSSRPIWKLTTKKQLHFPGTTTTTTTSPPPTTTTAATTTSSNDPPAPSNPWDLLRVSGCNIYGTFYKVDETIKSLSSDCKRCFCSPFGVQCSNLC